MTAKSVQTELPENNSGTLKCLVLFSMILPVSITWIYFAGIPEHALAKVLYLALKIFHIAAPLIAVVLIEKKKLRHFLPLHLSGFKSQTSWGILSGLLILGSMLGLFFYTPLGPYLTAYAPAVKTQVQQLGILEYYIPFGIFLAGFHSLIEEYYWRGFIYFRLKNWFPKPLALIFAGLAFAAHHYVVLSVYFDWKATVIFGTCTMIGGVFWCFLSDKNSNLLGSWISHALVDVGILVIGYQLIFM